MLHLKSHTMSRTSSRPVVSFTHASIVTYLSQGVTMQDAHSDIANISLGYMSMEGLMANDIRLIRHTRYRFLEYALSHRANHALRCTENLELNYLLALASKSSSALFKAAQRGLDDALHYLLKHGISPNRRHRTQSQLSIAAIHGQLLCASYPIKSSADMDYAGDEGEMQDTALTHESRSGHSQGVPLRTDSNADVDAGLVPPILKRYLNNGSPLCANSCRLVAIPTCDIKARQR
jgi:hypothetical protein